MLIHYFENASLLNQISYREAIELAFYGATVIHQNITTLQKKGNSFVCKSFINPLLKEQAFQRVNLEPYLPCLSLKELLISLSSIDFRLLWKKISEIFSLFHEFKLKVNLIQIPISFSVCVEDKFDNFNELNYFIKKIQS
jgi:aspartate kinase